ncbi:MAG: CDP-diacylglycerol--glycerol-3-phosphate 3-phosphatidyltransferase [Glaciecola sp.]
MGVKSNFGQTIDTIARPFGRAFAAAGISPNAITTMGIVLTGIATWLVANGKPVEAGWMLVFGGLMDTFDGATARASGKVSPFGAFYDSVSDRMSDGLILAGVAWWVRADARLFVLAVTALVAAQVTSYIRAKAEAIDLSCSVGVMERAERAIVLIFALVFHRWLVEPVLWLMAVGSVVTVVQRIHHVWCQIDRDIPAELLGVLSGDRAWNRAFLRGARRFYGQRNFDPALQEFSGHEAAGPAA